MGLNEKTRKFVEDLNKFYMSHFTYVHKNGMNIISMDNRDLYDDTRFIDIVTNDIIKEFGDHAISFLIVFDDGESDDGQ